MTVVNPPNLNPGEKSVENAEEKVSAEDSGSNLSYRGTLSGLRGLLNNKMTHKIAEGFASALGSMEKSMEKKNQNEDLKEGLIPVPIEKIYPCPSQPRQVFDPKTLEELAQTMRELGQAQAITVRKTPQGYEIISGERRYRAAKLAGLKSMDCLVKECSEKEARLLALVENTQRQDLLPIEEAFFLKKVLEDHPELSLEKLAKTLGSHKSTLSEKVQLAEIPADLHPILFSKGRNFTHRHWRVLSRIQDASFLRQMILKALEHQLSVSELERSLETAGVKKAVRSKKKQEAKGAESIRLFRRDGSLFRIKALTVDVKRIPESAKHALVEQLNFFIEQLLNPLDSSESAAETGSETMATGSSSEIIADV